jgi:hypothetical protein
MGISYILDFRFWILDSCGAPLPIHMRKVTERGFSTGAIILYAWTAFLL